MMEIQLIAATRPDGGVSMMSIIVGAPVHAFSTDAALANGFILSEDGMRWEGGITDEGVESELARAQVDWVSYRRVSADEVPTDRTFRNAWTDTGKAVSVDMIKARDIHRDNLRALRAPLLAALDIEYQRADETGDKAAKAVIAAKKQALRDVTIDPAIERASTSDELKAALPAALAR